MTFGEVLRELRKENKGLKLSQISALSNFSERKILRIENNDTELLVSEALVLLDIYGYKNDLNILLNYTRRD